MILRTPVCRLWQCETALIGKLSGVNRLLEKTSNNFFANVLSPCEFCWSGKTHTDDCLLHSGSYWFRNLQWFRKQILMSHFQIFTIFQDTNSYKIVFQFWNAGSNDIRSSSFQQVVNDTFFAFFERGPESTHGSYISETMHVHR